MVCPEHATFNLGVHHRAIMFFVATAFWNLFDVGVLGFLINTPVSRYFIQGLNTTATHAHGSFMGVGGNLGIGLMLFCLVGIIKRVGWNHKPLKWAFWSINMGMLAMTLMSLLPVGLVQFFASVESGYWFVRSLHLNPLILTPLIASKQPFFNDLSFSSRTLLAFFQACPRLNLYQS